MADQDSATCRFYRLFPGAPSPRRADRSADGMIGVRAYRYCEALASASALGFYFFPPVSFGLRLERNVVYWTYEGADGWMTLHGGQFPGFRDHFARIAPDGAKLLAPLCLAASREPGVVQIWSGYFAQTAPGWSLLSRSPVNIPITQDYEHFEGLIQTDHWCGPLFTNIRLTRTNSEVRFHTDYPLFQAQPIQRRCYHDLSFDLVDDADTVDWSHYIATMAPNRNQPDRSLGHYAVEIRKQRHRELAGA
jgi:hypothetical protein